ncbi:MAG TPA: glucose-6-phosphate isomerase [Lutibacter sp.]|nr:glucose-6-phosphate isomerase [Lutibacter sp.]
MSYLIDPTTTKSWEKLKTHFTEIESTHLNELFKKEATRKEDFTLVLEQLEFDFSKNRISKQTLEYLIDLTNETGLEKAIEDLFKGKKINNTENRAVLHTALRDFTDEKINIDGEYIFPMIESARKQIADFSEQIISKKWKGYTGKPITDIVNIGIGGSDLGPQMIVEALDYYKNRLNTHFISNIDGDAVYKTLSNLNPETTLFIVVSKTFTTIETLTNATTCKNWFLEKASLVAIEKHFVAVSSNEKAVVAFGINKKNIFPMWNWVGGRFSMWGSVGLSISLAIGYENFEAFLQGANTADKHFKNTKYSKNIPVIMALLSVWYTNFFNTKAEVVLPYADSLNKLVSYLQQLFMESNGKSVDRNGNSISYQTGSVIFGSSGTNAQHSFMQHIHQGTQMIPADFIGFTESLYGNTKHHAILMANFYAQSQALQQGKSKEAVHLNMKFKGDLKEINNLLPFKVFEGNRPSNSFLFDKLTPYNLGMLIALYEHKVFTQGIIWNINSFDQFGVELGKEMAKNS